MLVPGLTHLVELLHISALHPSVIVAVPLHPTVPRRAPQLWPKFEAFLTAKGGEEEERARRELTEQLQVGRGDGGAKEATHGCHGQRPDETRWGAQERVSSERKIGGARRTGLLTVGRKLSGWGA